MKIARIPINNDLPVGIPGFVRWLRVAQPAVHRALALRLSNASRLNGLGLVGPTATDASIVNAAADKPGLAQTIVNTVKDIASTVLPLYQQKKLFDMQLSRAAAGQPMLDAAQLSDASSVKVGVDAGTRNTGLIIAGVLAGGFVLSRLLGRRRG